jgi:hypothetical protein
MSSSVEAGYLLIVGFDFIRDLGAVHVAVLRLHHGDQLRAAPSACGA